jgi:hypothetical protein
MILKYCHRAKLPKAKTINYLITMSILAINFDSDLYFSINYRPPGDHIEEGLEVTISKTKFIAYCMTGCLC